MPQSPDFDMRGIGVKVASPERFSPEEWEDIHDMERWAYLEALGGHRSREEVDRMLGWDLTTPFTQSDYYRSRMDPNHSVRTGRNYPNQIYDKPLTAVAYDLSTREPVGLAYTANNTSGGSELERQLKMRIPPILPIPKVGHRRYEALGSLATSPDHWGRGISRVLMYRAFKERSRWQPVTAYVWDELPLVLRGLKAVGFTQPEPGLEDKPFGAQSREVIMNRLVAARAGKVMRNIVRLPGAKEAIRLSYAA